MPQILFTKKFTKQYQTLLKNQPKKAKKLEKLTEIFIQNPRHPLLKTHALGGKLAGKSAFWVSYNLRVVFQWLNKNSVRFLAIGTHNQVYK